MRRERFTVAFDGHAVEAIQTATALTNLRDMPDFIRAACTVMVDLLDASARKLTVVMRDDRTGREWEYSPHQPGRAVPLVRREGTGETDNILRPAFAKRKDVLPLGEYAMRMQPPIDAPEVANAAAATKHRSSRR